MNSFVLPSIVGNRSLLAVLRVLFSQTEGVTGRKVARLAHLSVQGGRDALAKLEGLGLVTWKPAGRAQLFRLNRDHRLVSAVLTPLFRGERVYWGEMLAELRDAAGANALSATIFGSGARGEASPGSDLDLFVVVKNAETAAKVERRLLERAGSFARNFHAQLSPIVMSLDKVTKRAKDDHSLLRTIVAEGVTIRGLPIQELIRGR